MAYNDTMISPTRYRFTVDDYHLMAEVGILPPDARIELIDGEIIQMTAMGPRHALRLARLNQRLTLQLADRALVWPQCPFQISPYSEPEPDLALVKLPASRYEGRLPTSEDILLAIEISESSLVYDRGTKLALYAKAGIPEAWIVNLQDDCLEIYRDPQEGRYGTATTYRAETPVAPLAFPDVPVPWWD